MPLPQLSNAIEPTQGVDRVDRAHFTQRAHFIGRNGIRRNQGAGEGKFFADACEREGVRPIFGASLTVREAGTLPLPREGRRPADASVILLARDAAGYANLCRLVTDAHMTGERGDPSLTPEQVCAHAGGLVALLGFTSPPGLAGIQILTPRGLRGRVTAVFLAAVSLAGFGLGPPLVGLLSDHLFGEAGLGLALLAVFAPVGAAGALAALLARRAWRRARRTYL